MIVFVTGYRPSTVSGGIRTVFTHAELLIAMGFPVVVLAPQGHPDFFESGANVFVTIPGSLGPDDDLVFPEAIAAGDGFCDYLLALPCRKHVFVQNHHYCRMGLRLVENRAGFGIEGIYACSGVVARALEAEFAVPDPPVVPCVIDTTLFQARDKALGVAVMPRKMPQAMVRIREGLCERHPRWRSVPWVEVEDCREREVADILGRSAVFLSLSHREGLGLPPLEAMAAGCLVAGFHGDGGREYATAENGFWCDDGDIDGCVAALAAALDTAAHHPDRCRAMRAAGDRTAAGFNPERAAGALRRYFGGSVPA